MRFKKGFTLAEILIVLMVIGALATMTIPALMKGVDEARYKTAYKKAYNALVNLCAMEKISGNMPSGAGNDAVTAMFNLLRTNLSVRDYALASASPADSGNVLSQSAFHSDVRGATTEDTFENNATDKVGTDDEIVYQAGTTSPWITTEDNMAYQVIGLTTAPTGGCGTKAVINGTGTNQGIAQACLTVLVDVNGLTQGPNRVQEATPTGFTETTTLPTLTKDRYYIYIGTDGATAGSKKNTVTGRIVADLK